MRSLMVLLLLLSATVADAAPRRRRVNSYTPAPMPRVESYTSSSMPIYTGNGGDTGSAQGVAEMMASRGTVQHFGNPTGGYEGVGMGSSPDEALNNCCYSRSGMQCVDQGVACGRNGRWYACKRYR